MQKYKKYLEYNKLFCYIPEFVDFSLPNLWTFRSRICGLFIPEFVDFSFPNLWTFHSRICGLFVPEFVDFSFPNLWTFHSYKRNDGS